MRYDELKKELYSLEWAKGIEIFPFELSAFKRLIKFGVNSPNIELVEKLITVNKICLEYEMGDIFLIGVNWSSGKLDYMIDFSNIQVFEYFCYQTKCKVVANQEYELIYRLMKAAHENTEVI